MDIVKWYGDDYEAKATVPSLLRTAIPRDNDVPRNSLLPPLPLTNGEEEATDQTRGKRLYSLRGVPLTSNDWGELEAIGFKRNVPSVAFKDMEPKPIDRDQGPLRQDNRRPAFRRISARNAKPTVDDPWISMPDDADENTSLDDDYRPVEGVGPNDKWYDAPKGAKKNTNRENDSPFTGEELHLLRQVQYEVDIINFTKLLFWVNSIVR